MQRHRNNDLGETSSGYERTNERAGTPHDTGSPKMGQSHSAEIRRRALLTPHSSTSDKNRRTTQNTGSGGRSDTQSEEYKRKQALTPSISTPEKVRRPAHGGRFVNSLIDQWVKNTGSQVPVPQSETPGDSSLEVENEQHGQDCEAHRHALRTLKRKFQDAQEVIIELRAWRENEFKLKDEIVAKINANWESMAVITKFSDYVTECLTVFQQKYDSLSALYNDVIITERATIQKLRQKLESIKSKGDESHKVVAVMEERLKIQEQQMVELHRDLKEAEEAEKKLQVTKSQLESSHAKETLKLTKERNELMVQNEQLESKLRRIEESSKNIEEEITEYKSKLDELARQNMELIKNVEASVLNESKLTAELESKIQEFNKLEEHLTERRKIEIDLSKDLDSIGSKYSGQAEQYKILQANFNEIQRKLKEVQGSNTELEASIEKMEANSKSEVVQLNQKIETLINEHENTLREERKNREFQISNRTKECDRKITGLQDTIAKQYADLTKMKEALDKSYAENQSLQDELVQVKKRDEQLMNMINMIEAAKAKSVTEPVLQDTRNVRSKSSEHQPIKEERPSSLKQNRQTFTTGEFTRQNKQGRMALSQPVGSQKKVRFNLESPKQDSHSVDLYSFSPTLDDSLMSSSQLSKKDEDKKEKSGTVSPNYKFFKSRGSVTKKYGSARKDRGRK